MALTDAFDKYSNAYDEWFEKNEWAYKSELEAVRRLLPEFTRAIEIGIGTGRFAIPLGIKRGADPSRQMVSIARKKGLLVAERPCEDLPFDDEQFDLILMVTAICFLDDVPKCMDELHGKLLPGGYFVVGFIDADSPLGIKYQAEKEESRFYSDATFYSVGKVRSFLERAGFVDITAVQTIFRPPAEMDCIDEVREGTGEGSFVVMRGRKS